MNLTKKVLSLLTSVFLLCLAGCGISIGPSDIREFEQDVLEKTGMVSVSFELDGGNVDGKELSRKVYKKGSEHRISAKIPQKEDCHFLSWRDQSGQEYRADEKIVFNESLAFTAQWVGREYDNSGIHQLKLKKHRKLWLVGEVESITVSCSGCGMEVQPGTMKLEEFCKLYNDGSQYHIIGEKARKETVRQYAIWNGCPQELADTICKLEEKFEEKKSAMEQADEVWSGITDGLDWVKNISLGETIISNKESIFTEIAEGAEEFSTMDDVMKATGQVLTLGKAASQFLGMIHAEGTEDACRSVLDFVDTVVGMSGPLQHAIYGKQLEVLKKGLEVYFAYYEREEIRQAIQDMMLQKAGEKFPAINELCTSEKYGLFLDAANWKKNYDQLPSVAKVAQLCQEQGTTLKEKEILQYYLQWRIKYEFKDMTGMEMSDFLTCFE